MLFSLEVRQEPSRDGVIALTADPSAFEGDRPVALFVQGALQSLSGQQGAWAPLLAPLADAVFVDLPGQGRSTPIIPATLGRFADNVADAAASALPGRRIVLVGESLGGLVSLAVASLGRLDIRATLLVDPPFTTAKQWQLYAYFNQMLTRQPDDAALASLAWEMFGITPGAQEERVYYPLLDQAPGPVHVITGDVALQPVRQMGVLSSVMDGADRFILERFYGDKVRLHTIPGAGHQVLAAQLEASAALVRTLMAEALGAPAP